MLIAATRELSDAVNALKFSAPVAYVYNPLDYARETHEQFLSRYGNGKKRVVFLGMNPGPFGMAQTGVPFGEIDAVQNWLGIFGFVGKPKKEHPAKPVDGFACTRSEVSGHRLWGLFKERFGMPENFFKEHFVTNFCPLLFAADGERGKNLTPENLAPAERDAVNTPCDLVLVRSREKFPRTRFLKNLKQKKRAPFGGNAFLNEALKFLRERGFRFFDNRVERCSVANREFAKVFAVDNDLRFFQTSNEAAIRDA